MDLDLVRRARAVFHEVVDLPADARARALAELCGDDDALRAKVEALLAADEEGFEALDTLPTAGVVRALAQAVDEDDTPPEVLGRYRVIREIGRGGMGIVYEAWQDEPRRRVALKRVHPWLHSGAAEAHFRAEVQAMADVLHPGIPQVYELFVHDDFLVVAMELVDGPSLPDALAGLDLPGRVRLLRGIADAVAAAHAVGVVHRDLKPGNVKLDAEGRVKVLDFGIAQRADDLGQSGGLGTLAYVAPEQLDGARVDERADVYALGVMGWEMVFDQLPVAVEGQDRRALRVARQAVPEPTRRVRRDLVAVLQQALQPDPGARMPSASALSLELGKVLDNRVVDALSADLRAQIGAFVRRNRWRLVMAVGLVLAAVSAVYGIGALGKLLDARALEAEGQQRLAAAQRLAERSGIDAPEVHAAFEAVVGDPKLARTRAVSEAWGWWGRAHPHDSDQQRAGLVKAYVLAPDGGSLHRARRDLARHLADQGLWEAVQGLADVDADPLPEDLSRQLVLARWDAAGARTQAVDPRIVALLDHAMVLERPVLRDVMIAGPGELLISAESHVEQLVDGAPGERWHLAGSVGALRSAEGVWVLVYDEHSRWPVRLLPGGVTERADMPLEGRHSIAGLAVGDADADGVDELYTSVGYPARQVLVAEPPFDPARVLATTDGRPTTARFMTLAELDGDPGLEMLLAFADWDGREVRVLDGLPEHPTVRGRFAMEVAGLLLAPGDDLPRTAWAVGSAVGSAPAGRRFGSPRRLVEFAVGARPGSEAAGAPQVSATRELVLPVEAADVFLVRLGGRPLLLTGRDDLVAVDPERLEVVAVVPGLAPRTVGDLDGDGDDEVVVVHKDRRAMILGLADGPPLPVRDLRGERDPPAGAPPGAGSVWERAEHLAALGLAGDASRAFLEIGRRSDEIGLLALVRAMEIAEAELQMHTALEAARRLASRPDATPDLVARAARVRVELHDLASIEGGAPEGAGTWLEEVGRALASAPTLDFEAPEPRLRLGPDGPGRVRWNPVVGALELDAVGPGATLVEVPLRWDEPVLDLEIDLQVDEISWGSTLQLWLGGQRVLSLGRGGPGPRADQELNLSAGSVRHTLDRGQFQWRGVLRVSLVDVDGRQTIALHGPDGAPLGVSELPGPIAHGPLDLQLLTRGLPDLGPRTRVRVRRITLRGVEIDPARSTADQGWRAMIGDPDALEAVAAGPPGLAAAQAAARLGRHDEVPFAELALADRQTLVRTQPDVWLPRARRLSASEFAASFHPFWLAATHQDPVFQDIVGDPALADLDLSRPELRPIAVQRALTLARLGRSTEARQLMEALAAWDEPVELWLALARTRVRLGDEAGAREAVERLLQSADDRPFAEDLLREEPALARLVSLGPPPQALPLEPEPATSTRRPR